MVSMLSRSRLSRRLNLVVCWYLFADVVSTYLSEEFRAAIWTEHHAENDVVVVRGMEFRESSSG